MDLVAYEQNLPANLEDLSKFILVGREKLTSVRAEIRAIDKLNLAEEVRNQKREEAQMLSEALLAQFKDEQGIRSYFNFKDPEGQSKYVNVDETEDMDALKGVNQQITRKYFGLKKAKRKLDQRILDLGGQISFEFEVKE